MKVIFLDFDGTVKFNGNRRFHLEAIEALNHIIARTGAQVVISSIWRYNYNLEQLQGMLNRDGFQGEVIGETLKDPDPEGGSSIIIPLPRGKKILLWAEEHQVTDWVALDDWWDLSMLALGKRLVRTDEEVLLTMSLAELAIRILTP